MKHAIANPDSNPSIYIHVPVYVKKIKTDNFFNRANLRKLLTGLAIICLTGLAVTCLTRLAITLLSGLIYCNSNKIVT
jgi:hypothetical protein